VQLLAVTSASPTKKTKDIGKKDVTELFVSIKKGPMDSDIAKGGSFYGL
jgi:hypothetical protein